MFQHFDGRAHDDERLQPNDVVEPDDDDGRSSKRLEMPARSCSGAELFPLWNLNLVDDSQLTRNRYHLSLPLCCSLYLMIILHCLCIGPKSGWGRWDAGADIYPSDLLYSWPVGDAVVVVVVQEFERDSWLFPVVVVVALDLILCVLWLMK